MQRTRDIRILVDKASRSRCVRCPDSALLVLGNEIICKPCESNGFNTVIERLPSETQKYMTGQTQSAAIHSKLAQKYGAWNMTAEVTDLATIEPTQGDIERVGKKFASMIENFGADGEAKLSRSDLVLAAKLEMAGFQHFHFYVQQHRYQQQGQWHVKSSLYMNLKGRYFNAQRSMAALYGGVTLDIISDQTVREAADIETGEVLVQATLWEKTADGGKIVRQQSFGRAGGARDDKQPVAKANKLEMAETRAEARVLERGAQLGVPIGTYVEVAGIAVVSDGEGQVAALEASEAPALETGWTDPELGDQKKVAVSVTTTSIDRDTGEITETVNRNNAKNRKELADRLKANGITKEQVESLDLDPSQMLIDGSEPHFIADAISNLLKVPQPTVTVEGDEEVQSLPW